MPPEEWPALAVPETHPGRGGNAVFGTLRSVGDTPCDLDIYDVKPAKREHQRCDDNPKRKATPMLPEPTLPKPQAAAASLQRTWVMTPLFCAPSSSASANPAQPAGRRSASAPRRAPRRPGSRSQKSQGNRSLVAVKPGPPRTDTADLLTISADQLQRALWRSFLRYGVAGDLDTAVHAAMNVIEPVLAARDTEIGRLLKARTPRGPRR
jgi:hypothetical protein